MSQQQRRWRGVLLATLVGLCANAAGVLACHSLGGVGTRGLPDRRDRATDQQESRPWRLLTLLLLVSSSCGIVAAVLYQSSPSGHRVVTPAPAGRLGPRADAQGGLAPLPNQAAIVTAFARGTLVPRVLVIESALAVANHHVGAHLAGEEDDGTLARAFTMQALALTGASADVSRLLPPRLDVLATLQLQCVLEDLALVSDQLSGLLGETATVLQTAPSLEAGGAVLADEATRSVAYAPRVHSALTILRRAEAWLETVDHETGAHVALPGFGPGASSLEGQLALQ